MTKWEYIIVGMTGNIIPVAELNTLGADGWELIGVGNFVGYFKRPVQAKKATKRKTTKRANS